MSIPAPRSSGSVPPASPGVAPDSAGRPTRRWLRGLGIASLVLGALVAVLPQIVALSPLRHEFPRVRLRGFTGNIRVARASLSWWGPTVLDEIELDDLDGNVFAKIRHYTEQRSVFAMVMQRPDPSIIHAEGADINVVLRPDGSNVEEALRPVIEFHKSRPRRERTIDVEDSVLHVTDSSNGKKVDWKEIGLSIHISTIPAAENRFKILATLADAPDASPLDLEYTWTTPPADGAISDQKQRMRLRTIELPLRFLNPLHSRMASDLDLTGELTTDLDLEIRSGSDPGFNADGRFAIHELNLACPSRIGSDRLTLDELALRGTLASKDGLFHATNLEIESELGTVTANGTFPVVALSGTDPEAAADRLQQGDFELKGSLDLVQIAQRLPDTLRLKSGARISEGKVTIDLACRGAEKLARWSGSLETSRLAGEVEGRPVTWEQPIKFNFDVSRGTDHFKIEKFECQSDVLELTGSGDSNSAHFEARCDLAQLTTQLSQFLDLQDRRWEGALSASANLGREEGSTLVVTSAATVKNFALRRPGKEIWSEPHLASGLTCQLTVEHLRPSRIESLVATLSGVDESDSIKATLIEPVDLTADAHSWNLALEMAGDLAHWRTRLHLGETLANWNVAGTFQSKGRLSIAEDVLQIDDHSAEIIGLHLSSADVNLTEPVVKLTGAARWDRQSRELRIPEFECSAAPGRITVKEIAWSRGEQGLPALAGRVLVDSDLALLNPVDARENERPWGGTIHGEVSLAHNDGQTRGDWRVDVENLIIRRERTKLVERRRGDVEQITIDAPPIEVPRPPPGTVVDRRMRRAIEKAEREARREADRREKAIRKMADEIVVIPTVEWKTVWNDPKLTLRGVTRFDSSGDDVEFEQLAIESNGFTWSAHGKLSETSSRAVLDLSGEVDYDVALLLERLQESISRFIKLTGKEHHAFTLKGPLRSQQSDGDALIPLELAGATAGGWQSGTLFGLDAGPADFNLSLANAVVAMQPFEFPLSGGKLRMAPEVRLSSRPAMLYLPKGPVLENVALTREVCDGWLKFIAPVLAEAARAEGQFSLSLEESQLPLFDLASGKLDGQLQIASGQVLPGPMFGELAGFLGQIEATVSRGQSGGLLSPDQPLMLIDRQTVNFRLRDKRLYHSPMTFNVKGVPVRTRGSVGADQSLDLLAEIMFPAPWARRVPLIAHLDGKVFEVPIRGTLRQPKIDGKAIGKAWEQFGLDVLDNLLNGGLIPR